MHDGFEDAFSLLERDSGRLDLRARFTDVVVVSGPVSHAVDRLGQRHLLIPLDETQAPLEDVSARGVTVTTHTLVDSGTEGRYLDVKCVLGQLNDLFSWCATKYSCVSQRTRQRLARCVNLFSTGGVSCLQRHTAICSTGPFCQVCSQSFTCSKCLRICLRDVR